MKRRDLLMASASLGGLVALAPLSGCATQGASAAPWQTVFDQGQGQDNFFLIGDANFRVVDGNLQADKGVGFLTTKQSFSDFEMRVEFWADDNANSGIFIRMQDLRTVTAGNSYEVNIFDKRPGQEYSTGAIVDVAKVPLPAPKAGGKWNTFDIRAVGSQLTVSLNGVQTVDVQDGKHRSGPFSLQYAPGVVKDSGTIKFRKVMIRQL